MVLATIWRNVAVFLQSAPIAVIISLLGLRTLNFNILLLFPALLLASTVLVATGYIFAAIGNRFPAFGVLLPSILLLVFLSTPILWDPEVVGERTWLYKYNPLYWIISLVRDPLIFEVPPTAAWTIGVLCATVLAALAVWTTAKVDRKVPLRL